jgi:SSS family solute:Na+ symporter
LLALLGYCAIAAGIKVGPQATSSVVPLLFARFFPDWFAGVAGAAVVIGALVPAAIMCIGAANLFASNVFREFSTERTPVETVVARVLTLVMCACGLLLIFFVPVPYDIDFQLLGGALMLQIFPAFVLGLWTRWFHARALLAGWAVGLVTSCFLAYAGGFGPNFTVHAFGLTVTGFIALYGLIVNLCVAAIATFAFRSAGMPTGDDRTSAGDYA